MGCFPFPRRPSIPRFLSAIDGSSGVGSGAALGGGQSGCRSLAEQMRCLGGRRLPEREARWRLSLNHELLPTPGRHRLPGCASRPGVAEQVRSVEVIES
jgi:hypothetical protein